MGGQKLAQKRLRGPKNPFSQENTLQFMRKSFKTKLVGPFKKCLRAIFGPRAPGWPPLSYKMVLQDGPTRWSFKMVLYLAKTWFLKCQDQEPWPRSRQKLRFLRYLRLSRSCRDKLRPPGLIGTFLLTYKIKVKCFS